MGLSITLLRRSNRYVPLDGYALLVDTSDELYRLAAWVVHGRLDGRVGRTGYLTDARANLSSSTPVSARLAKAGIAPAAQAGLTRRELELLALAVLVDLEGPVGPASAGRAVRRT